jgi:hypothetical protein
MSRFTVVRLLVAAYIVWGAWNWYIDRPLHRMAGILAPAEPLQTPVDSAAPATRVGRWILTPRADYRITARILRVERYRFDSLAALVPEDLALGWGPMSDSRILDTMEITQSNRFYFWRLSRDQPISKEDVIAHSANTHVIPRDSAIAALLHRLRRGEVVTLSGLLVDARRDDGAWINTSLGRTDTGAGACELMLVDDVSVEP